MSDLTGKKRKPRTSPVRARGALNVWLVDAGPEGEAEIEQNVARWFERRPGVPA